MNSKLKHIQNWPELASRANWSASALAKHCGVSVRTLHRYFLMEMGNHPKAWLAEKRLLQAVELLCDGSSVKETAARLGYKQPSNFTRQYKNQIGICPSKQSPASHISSKMSANDK